MQIRAQSVDGYIYGLTQPSIVLRCPLPVSLDPSLEKTFSHLKGMLTLESIDKVFDSQGLDIAKSSGATLFVRFFDHLNSVGGDRRFSEVLAHRQNDEIAYVVPTLSTALARANLNVLLHVLKIGPQELSEGKMAGIFEMCKKTGKQHLPGGTNSGNFISAAAKHRIPFRIFAKDHLIFGYGSGSTIIKSSITDKESGIGVAFAKSKVQTHDFLQLSGFPVPDQARVKTVEDAVRCAESFGYPVVLKPEHEEQGRGIRANILDEAELRNCFDDVSKTYKGLLLEKHIAGDHYRIDFMGDQLIKAVRRRPASVVGDGQSTIEQLIHGLNDHPDRRDPNSSMKPVEFDDDLSRTLSKHKNALVDVPKKGERVWLRSISNLSRGGEQVHVADEVHEENYQLCRSIARAMRLDVAGIDLLSPDLSRPWYETETVVCEVNAQPQLGISGTEVYWTFLRRYLKPPSAVKIVVSNTAQRSVTPLFDTNASDLEICLTPKDIFRSGCPTQYFSELEIRDDVSPKDREALKRILVSVPPRKNAI